PPPPPRTHPDDMALDGDDRPRRRTKGGSKMGLILGLSIGGVLLLGLTGFGIWYFVAGGGGLGDEQKFFPDGTQYVVSIRVDDFLSSGVWKDNKKEIPNVDDKMKDFEKEMGVGIDKIERVIVAGKAPNMTPKVVAQPRFGPKGELIPPPPVK